MKNKTLLCVFLPATGKTYDLWIPNKMQLHNATPLISGILDSKEQDFFCKSSEASFMLKESGEILDSNQSVQELSLINGTQIVLV